MRGFPLKEELLSGAFCLFGYFYIGILVPVCLPRHFHQRLLDIAGASANDEESGKTGHQLILILRPAGSVGGLLLPELFSFYLQMYLED